MSYSAPMSDVNGGGADPTLGTLGMALNLNAQGSPTVTMAVSPGGTPAAGRFAQETSMWVGDLDPFMDENFLREAVDTCGWGSKIVRIKVIRNHATKAHAGYGFFDCVSEEDAREIMERGNGTPIPGTTRIWRLNLGREGPQRSGIEANVYVGDVPPNVTGYDLMQLFKARYPSVRHAKVVCDEKGSPKGYAFVRFANAQECDRAVAEMDGFELHGRKLHLNLANRPRPPRNDKRVQQPYGLPRSQQVGGMASGSGKRPRNPISQDDPNNTTLFIGGTAPYLQEDALWREFSQFGEVIAVRLPATRTGFAFVRFRSRESATSAKISLNGMQVNQLNNQKPIRIEWATEQIEPQVNPMQYHMAALQALYGFMQGAQNNPAMMQQQPNYASAQMLQNYAYYFHSNTHAPPAKRQASNERGYEDQGSQQENPHVVNS